MSGRWIPVRGARTAADRLSLSYGVINNARETWIIAAGEGEGRGGTKGAVIHRRSQGPGRRLVAGRVATRWLLDRAAASQLGDQGDRVSELLGVCPADQSWDLVLVEHGRRCGFEPLFGDRVGESQRVVQRIEVGQEVGELDERVRLSRRQY